MFCARKYSGDLPGAEEWLAGPSDQHQDGAMTVTTAMTTMIITVTVLMVLLMVAVIKFLATHLCIHWLHCAHVEQRCRTAHPR